MPSCLRPFPTRIALGDPAIEELFFLAASIGHDHIELIFTPSASPMDHATPATTPAWLVDRYRAIAARLTELEQ